jgi:hypothetical protein
MSLAHKDSSEYGDRQHKIYTKMRTDSVLLECRARESKIAIPRKLRFLSVLEPSTNDRLLQDALMMMASEPEA